MLENLQVEIEGFPEKLVFAATVDKLGSDEGRSFATQFPLHGNSAVKLICEFHCNERDYVFESKPYTMKLNAILNKDNKWVCLKTFVIFISEKSAGIINGEAFVVHDNHKWT